MTKVIDWKELMVMRKIKFIVSMFFLLVVICFCYLTNIWTQKAEKMTVDECVQCLMEYIYDEDYLSICTVYYSREDGPLLIVYSDLMGYPIYEFELPDERLPIRRQIFCIGETEDEEYLVLGLFSWNYEMVDGERSYTHANYASSFAVNRITKEIIPQRSEDEEGLWVYDDKYYKIVGESLIYKDFYD